MLTRRTEAMSLTRLIPLLALLATGACDAHPAVTPVEYPPGQPIGIRLALGSARTIVTLNADGSIAGAPVTLGYHYTDDDSFLVEAVVLSSPYNPLAPDVSYELRVTPVDTTVLVYSSSDFDRLGGILTRKRDAQTAIVVALFDRKVGRLALDPSTLPVTVQEYR